MSEMPRLRVYEEAGSSRDIVVRHITMADDREGPLTTISMLLYTHIHKE